MKSVVVIGGYGGFGSRLCRRLAKDGWRVVVAGRNIERARELAAELPHGEAAAIDRTGDLEAALAALAPLLVVDAAGPFQDSDYRVPEACIALGIHYCDLADARGFVTGIDRLDEQARQAGVAVVSGASSVPALSGALVRKLAASFECVSKVAIAISASDKAVAGTSVTNAILSYVGKPVPLRRGGRRDLASGWQELDRVRLRMHGPERFDRLVALADVPDLDIWPKRLAGSPATVFFAGPEHGFQVRALSWLGAAVRRGWIGSLAPLARLVRPMQALTRPFSDGRSAMTVELSGYGEDGMQIARWELLATDGDGPEIPVLAAQLLARKLLEGGLGPGARDAHAELDLAAFEREFAALSIATAEVVEPFTPLYRRVLGARFDDLPEPIRAMHDLCGDGGAAGQANVTRGGNPLARLIGWIMRFPKAGEHRLHVAFTADGSGETWTREFGSQRFSSRLSANQGHLTERFGPLRFTFDLPVTSQGLAMVIRRWTAFGIPMPLALAPRIAASESVEQGRFAFDVAIAMPLIGNIVRYCGRLTPIGEATARGLPSGKREILRDPRAYPL